MKNIDENDYILEDMGPTSLIRLYRRLFDEQKVNNSMHGNFMLKVAEQLAEIAQKYIREYVNVPRR